MCPECEIGHLIQLVDADRDIAYCPICESIIEDYIVRVECKK
jgi:hypothetical protein